MAAYESYLRARQLLPRMTRPDLVQSAAAFEDAIALDPGYAPAWAGLATVSATLFEWFGSKATDLRRAEDASRTALSLAPDLAESRVARGFVLSLHRRYGEAAEEFGRAIALERTKQWPKAEADFDKALELMPDEPHVLNYLGYSWIDQGLNLDEGMRMIRRAVEQRPDDGYIVDSLGWAYYRLGNYEDAVKHLDRAVELKPDDPTINDHLGDAYWKIGRVLEAKFQWAHARDLKPEPDELAKINQKLQDGLKDEAARLEKLPRNYSMKIFPHALARQSGRRELHVHRDPYSSSLFRENKNFIERLMLRDAFEIVSTEMINAKCIDDIRGDFGDVDFVDIDPRTYNLCPQALAAKLERAEAEGISMQEAARRAVREFVVRGQHRDRVGAAAALVMDRHADALRRLGE